MAMDVQGTVREILINAIENAGKVSNGGSESGSDKGASKSHSGGKAALAAAGVGAAALVPVAVKGVGKLADELGISTLEVLRSPEKALEGLTDRVKSGIGDKIEES